MQEILDQIWNKVVVGLDWLKQVIFGEFEDKRDISAVIADMLVSFVPGVIIVTSARDLTAVLLRMVKRPERRTAIEEWMLVIGCAIPLVLPVLAAAAGAAAAGVGAVVGGVAGSEAGAALRAVCLLLIKKGMPLIEMVGFLRRFIKGNIMKVLQDIRFVRYGEAMSRYVGEFIQKILNIIRKLRAELLQHNYFQWAEQVLAKLSELEQGFYGVQTHAIQAIPRALAELDARLQHVLAEALPHSPKPVVSGVPAKLPKPIKPEPQRVPAMPGNPLGHPEGTHPAKPAAKAQPEPNVHPEDPHEPKLKAMKEKKVPCFKADNLPATKTPEFERQLAGQQAGLNEMTVQEYLDGRTAF